MTLLARLVRLYNTTEPGNIYHEILGIMLANLTLLPTLSLEETAELCNTSVITINRLLKKIDCSSFRLFKHQLNDIIDGYDKFNRFFPYAEYSLENLQEIYAGFFQDSITNLMKLIDLEQLTSIADLLHAAEDVHFYCEFACNHAKQQFQMDLIYTGKNVISLADTNAQMNDIKNLTNKSVVIITNQPILPYYTSRQKVMKTVSETGATVVVITSETTPHASRYADFTLHFKGYDMISDNYFIDMIFNLLCLTYRTKYID